MTKKIHWLRRGLVVLITVLALQVLKTVLAKVHLAGSYALGVFCIYLQVLMICGFCLQFLYFLCLSFIKRTRPRVIWASLIAAGTLLGLELLCTFWLEHPASIPAFLRSTFRMYYDRFDRSIIQYERDQTVYDTALFYRLSPSASFQNRNREYDNLYTTNRAGMRDDDASVDSPSIVCLGDSYTMGWGVEQPQAFPQQLETLSGLRVLNAGMSSYGTAREMLQLHRVNTSRLRYLVYQYCSNDVTENHAFIANDYVLHVSPRTTFEGLQEEFRWSRLYYPCKNVSLISQLGVKELINTVRPVFATGDTTTLAGDSLQAAAFLNVICNSGIDVREYKIIVLVADAYEAMHSSFLAEVRALSTMPPYRDKLPQPLLTLDLSRTLDRQDYYILDQHLRPSGHAKIARKIWDLIASDPGLR